MNRGAGSQLLQIQARVEKLSLAFSLQIERKTHNVPLSLRVLLMLVSIYLTDDSLGSPMEEGWSCYKKCSVPSKCGHKGSGGSWPGEGSLQGHGYRRAFKECPLSCLAFCVGCLEMGLWNSHQNDEIRKEPMAVLRKQRTLMILHLFVKPRNSSFLF